MEEIRDNKIQKVENSKNLTVIVIEERDYIDFIGHDKQGYKISYNYLKSCYIKELY